MKREIAHEVYRVFYSFPEFNWCNTSKILFIYVAKIGDEDLAGKVLRYLIDKALRTTDYSNLWSITNKDTEPEACLMLNKLGLFNETHALINEIKISSRNKYFTSRPYHTKRRFKKRFQAQYKQQTNFSLCSCCYEYLLKAQEIDGFPLIHDEKYIRVLFERAFKQPEIPKRQFLVNALLKNYEMKSPNLSLFLKYWKRAEEIGATGEFSFNPALQSALLDKRYFNILISIFNHRHSDHDNLIGDLMHILLERDQQDLAYFLSAKLSSPNQRILKSCGNVLLKNTPNERDLTFLKRVYESTLHEKFLSL